MTYNVFGGTLNLTQSINQSMSFNHQKFIMQFISIIKNGLVNSR